MWCFFVIEGDGGVVLCFGEVGLQFVQSVYIVRCLGVIVQCGVLNGGGGGVYEVEVVDVWCFVVVECQ